MCVIRLCHDACKEIGRGGTERKKKREREREREREGGGVVHVHADAGNL
jgi:hypothetical protein